MGASIKKGFGNSFQKFVIVIVSLSHKALKIKYTPFVTSVWARDKEGAWKTDQDEHECIVGCCDKLEYVITRWLQPSWEKM
jgi:hypothetical protein